MPCMRKQEQIILTQRLEKRKEKEK